MYVSHKIRIFSDFVLTSEKTLIIIKPQLKNSCTPLLFFPLEHLGDDLILGFVVEA